MANNVNIDINSNKVNVLSSDNNITITKDTKVVNVTEEVNKVIEIITRGPQGPKGADGSGGGSDLNALTTASVARNEITFTKGSGDTFSISINEVPLAAEASLVLADNIQQPFTSVEATSLTGSLDYSYIENVPDFVDTTGDIEANQIAIFAETFGGIPDSLPFSIPLENDGNPTIKGVSGLTFDGSSFKVQGIITGSNIPPNLINLKGNAQPNQLVRFVDTTDTELPIPLPFYVPVNDGNPTVEAVTGLSMTGDLLTLTGSLSTSKSIITSGSLVIAKTGSLTDPALLIGRNSGWIAGNNSGIILEELAPDTTFFVPYFVSNGAKIFGFGTVMSMEKNLDMQSNRLYFDGDSVNTYISSNADDPEDLEIHAEQDIILGPINGSVIVDSEISASSTGSFQHLKLDYSSLPTSDPGIEGVVYRDGSNQLFISQG